MEQLVDEPLDAVWRDLADLALELVDRVGVEGAIRYCNSLGWGGVLAQIEAIRARRQNRP